jgi:hypothetical protein
MKYLRRVAAMSLVGVLGCGPQAMDQAGANAERPRRERSPDSIAGVAFSAVKFVSTQESVSNFKTALGTMYQNQTAILMGIDNLETIAQQAAFTTAETGCQGVISALKPQIENLAADPDDPNFSGATNLLTAVETVANIASEEVYYNISNVNLGSFSFTPEFCMGPFVGSVSTWLLAMDSFYPFPGFESQSRFHTVGCGFQKTAAILQVCTKGWADSQCQVSFYKIAPICNYSRRPPCIFLPNPYTYTVSCYTNSLQALQGPYPGAANPFPFSSSFPTTTVASGFFATSAEAAAAGNAALATARNSIESVSGVPDLTDLATGLTTLLTPSGGCAPYTITPYVLGTGQCPELGQ